MLAGLPVLSGMRIRLTSAPPAIPMHVTGRHHLRTTPDDLYFVRVGEFLKIGRSRNLKERFRIIRSHSPTTPELIGSIAGAGHTEKAWHYAFRMIQSRGEWFKIGPALKEAVNAALRGEDWMELGPQRWRDEVQRFAIRRNLR